MISRHIKRQVERRIVRKEKLNEVLICTVVAASAAITTIIGILCYIG